MSPGARTLLAGLRERDQKVIDSVYPLKKYLDELVKMGLVSSGETYIRDYAYVTKFSVTEAGKEFKL